MLDGALCLHRVWGFIGFRLLRLGFKGLPNYVGTWTLRGSTQCVYCPGGTLDVNKIQASALISIHPKSLQSFQNRQETLSDS